MNVTQTNYGLHSNFTILHVVSNDDDEVLAAERHQALPGRHLNFSHSHCQVHCKE